MTYQGVKHKCNWHKTKFCSTEGSFTFINRYVDESVGASRCALYRTTCHTNTLNVWLTDSYNTPDSLASLGH